MFCSHSSRLQLIKRVDKACPNIGVFLVLHRGQRQQVDRATSSSSRSFLSNTSTCSLALSACNLTSPIPLISTSKELSLGSFSVISVIKDQGLRLSECKLSDCCALCASLRLLAASSRRSHRCYEVTSPQHCCRRALRFS